MGDVVRKYAKMNNIGNTDKEIGTFAKSENPPDQLYFFLFREYARNWAHVMDSRCYQKWV